MKYTYTCIKYSVTFTRVFQFASNLTDIIMIVESHYVVNDISERFI